MAITVEKLVIYPIKSCTGIEKQEAVTGPRGFLHDRLWMFVDEKGAMTTQRKVPKLGRVVPVLDLGPAGGAGTVLTLTCPELKGKLQSVKVKLIVPGAEGQRVAVKVWGDAVEALAVENDADTRHFVREATGRADLRLVQFPLDGSRIIGEKYFRGLEGALQGVNQAGFSDKFPYLLLSSASMAEINNRAQSDPGYQPGKHELSSSRFRPNIIVKAADLAPHAEDSWLEVRIGPSATFHCVHPCERCVLTTVDPKTHAFDKVSDPHHTLRLLKEYRDFGGGPMFGQNCVCHTLGVRVRVGDAVAVVAQKSKEHMQEITLPNGGGKLRGSSSARRWKCALWSLAAAGTALLAVLARRGRA
ncbi:hypothetical protein DIPPA_27179 [Diplonema papillatum]|nr:hypothetical protein DIPPA_27179 [Diplonema papillatum]